VAATFTVAETATTLTKISAQNAKNPIASGLPTEQLKTVAHFLNSKSSPISLWIPQKYPQRQKRQKRRFGLSSDSFSPGISIS
jgi:hypothetical protein